MNPGAREEASAALGSWEAALFPDPDPDPGPSIEASIFLFPN